jgi:hypothetical protein
MGMVVVVLLVDWERLGKRDVEPKHLLQKSSTMHLP